MTPLKMQDFLLMNIALDATILTGKEIIEGKELFVAFMTEVIIET